jgi:hypothetical protein
MKSAPLTYQFYLLPWCVQEMEWLKADTYRYEFA